MANSLMKIYFLLLLVCFNFLEARDVIQNGDSCQINWTKQYMICAGISEEGQSEYAATISAKVIAQRNMLEFVKGVKIDSQTTIKDGMLKSDIIRASVKGVVRGARIVSKQYDKKLRRATVKIKVSLYKDILKSILTQRVSRCVPKKEKGIIEKFMSAFYLYADNYYDWSEKKTLKKLLEDFQEKNDNKAIAYIKNIIKKLNSKNYTGILVDASDVNEFNLALIPKIRKPNGQEIYPKNFLNKDALIRKGGPIVYEIGLKDAINNKRVFNKPIVLHAIGIYGKRLSDLVLDKKSIKMLNKINKNLFKNAKVVILVGE